MVCPIHPGSVWGPSHTQTSFGKDREERIEGVVWGAVPTIRVLLDGADHLYPVGSGYPFRERRIWMGGFSLPGGGSFGIWLIVVWVVAVRAVRVSAVGARCVWKPGGLVVGWLWLWSARPAGSGSFLVAEC